MIVLWSSYFSNGNIYAVADIPHQHYSDGIISISQEDLGAHENQRHVDQWDGLQRPH